MTTLESIRQFRIGPYAIFDLVISFVGIYLIAPQLSKLFRKVNLNISRTSWLLLTLPLSLIIHLLFNQKTQMVKDVFNPNGHYLIKIILVTLTYFGLKNIKKSSS